MRCYYKYLCTFNSVRKILPAIKKNIFINSGGPIPLCIGPAPLQRPRTNSAAAPYHSVAAPYHSAAAPYHCSGPVPLCSGPVPLCSGPVPLCSDPVPLQRPRTTAAAQYHSAAGKSNADLDLHAHVLPKDPIKQQGWVLHLKIIILYIHFKKKS